MAIVTHHGSDISHAAILVKTMNIPALIEIDTDTEWDGQLAIVDGYTGCLYINTDEEVKKEYEIRRQADMEEREELLKLSDESILRAHEFQTNLIQSALNMESEEESYASLLMVHGQDHLMDAMVVRDLAKEMLEMYRMIAELKKEHETV